MWTGEGAPWPPLQWPLQQSAYQNIPHEQVDWAALAQQWIQMKGSMNETSDSQSLSQAHCAPARPHQPVNNRPLLHRPGTVGPSVEGNHGPQLLPDRNMPPGSSQNLGVVPTERDNDNGSYDQADNNWISGGPGFWQSPSWNNGPPSWALPPSHPPENRDSYEFGRNYGNQGYGGQFSNYNHGSDQLYFNQHGDQSSYNQYWPQSGPMNAPFARENVKDRQGRDESPAVAEEEAPAPFALDAMKCKNLPAWIREGLEKMDRDKQKKLDRERMLQEREERLRKQKEEEAAILREMQAAKEKGTSYPPRKSKFESDSEDENSSDSRQNSPRRSVSPFRKRSPSPLSAIKSEPEQFEEMIFKVRQMLTEILMEVTNEEILMIAKDMLSKERIKAPAHQLAKSSALASITGSLGLEDYGSDSETSEADPEKGTDSDAELQGTVQRRKAEFAERERQIAAAFNNELTDDGDETEEDARKNKTTSNTRIERPNQGDGVFIASITSEPGRERYHFEKKYDEIPGLGDQENGSKRTSKSSGISSTEKKNVSKENSSFTRSDSESSENSRKQNLPSKEKHERSKSDSSRSRSPEARRKIRRDSSSSRRGSRNNKNKRKSRSRSKERSYRRQSESHGSRKSRSRSRERRNSYSGSRRRRSRTRSRSRSYERSRYHHKDSRKRSRSRTSSSRSDRSRSRERRSSRRSRSRSLKK